MSSHNDCLGGIPLVDTSPGSPVQDLLGAAGHESDGEFSRSIWMEFRSELDRQLNLLQQENYDEEGLKNALHAIRGTSSQFGLSLLEIFLFAWEKKESDPVGATSRYLPGAISIARLSLDAVEHNLPHLKSPGG
jgi:hypothetical protein